MLLSSRYPISVQQAHVLVIEDKLDNLAVIQKLLAYSGIPSEHCSYKTVSTGILQFAECFERIDLILLDLFFSADPISGYDILREIRSHPQFKDTRVVAITGHAQEMKQTRAAGFDGFIAKPFLRDRFPDQIKRILAGESVWECK